MFKIAITLKEIADLAGVSRGTVDKVIHGRPGVSDKTREKVQTLLSEHQYVPSQAGKFLANQKREIAVGVVIIADKDNDYFYNIKKGMTAVYQELKQDNFSIQYAFVQKNNEDFLINAMEILIKNNVNAIVIPPYNTQKVTEFVDTLSGNGIHVVTYSTDINTENILFYVGNNYYQSGVIAASLLGKLLDNKGNIVIIEGDSGIKCHEDRLKGFLDHTNQNSRSINVIKTIPQSKNELESYFSMRELLQSCPAIDGIFIVSRGIEGVISAVREIGLLPRPKIVMFDLNRDAKKFLASGDVDFVVDQNPLHQGRLIINTLFQYLFFNKPIDKKYFYTPFSIHIKESVDAEE